MNDLVELMKKADVIVKAKPTWKRFIDGTPLANDVAVWMAEFAEGMTSELEEQLVGTQAENVKLREAGEAVVKRWDSPDWKDGTHTADYIHALRKALAQPTNTEALDEVVRKAKIEVLRELIVSEYAPVSIGRVESFIEELESEGEK